MLSLFLISDAFVSIKLYPNFFAITLMQVVFPIPGLPLNKIAFAFKFYLGFCNCIGYPFT